MLIFTSNNFSELLRVYFNELLRVYFSKLLEANISI